MKLLFGQLNVAATLPPAIAAQDAAVTQTLFESPARDDSAPMAKALMLRTVARAMGDLTHEQHAVATHPAQFAAQPQLLCSSTIAFYEGVAKLPQEQRRLVLRALFQQYAQLRQPTTTSASKAAATPAPHRVRANSLLLPAAPSPPDRLLLKPSGMLSSELGPARGEERNPVRGDIAEFLK